MLASTVVTPIRLYPLYCTLYFCTLTLTCRQLSAPVASSSAFVSDFMLKFCSVDSNAYNFHSIFSLAISFRNQQFFQKPVFLSCWKYAGSYHNSRLRTCFLVALKFLIVRLHSLTLFALTFLCIAFQPIDFLFCSKQATPSSICPLFCPTVASNFCSSWDESLPNLWALPTFSNLANMFHEDLTHPVAAAATSQVKLCPYNE